MAGNVDRAKGLSCRRRYTGQSQDCWWEAKNNTTTLPHIPDGKTAASSTMQDERLSVHLQRHRGKLLLGESRRDLNQSLALFVIQAVDLLQ
ncbi:hypothetical protein SKAU_G00221910 [Synaphobranchus kaupii]|uniref:Uncharacterized protein n=1 Tax=Synaphobranchus kaupii TaxID=118154 RepID=A0A9Q1FAU3_SYNKA|nr:hypothetical protein SKAU_G00221910 [Synaphobranchus kaupii]